MEKKGHCLLEVPFPNIACCSWGPRILSGCPGDSLLVREAESNTLGFQERRWTWETACKIRLLTPPPCNFTPNPQIHVSSRLPHSPLCPQPSVQVQPGTGLYAAPTGAPCLQGGGLPLCSLLLPCAAPAPQGHSRP